MPQPGLPRTRRLFLAALLLALAGCRPPDDEAPPAPREDRLSVAEMNADLDQLQTELEERFAYLRAGDPDYRGAIAAIRPRLREGMSAGEFGCELVRLRGLFVDCHADIQGFALPAGFLPFRLEAAGGRVVAVEPGRAAFVDPAFPFVARIDGRSIGEWLQLLRPIIARGSPQYVRSRALHYLSHIRYARSVAGIEGGDAVAVELESRDGKRRLGRSLEIASAWSGGGRWPTGPSRLLEPNIGYLRIHDWDDSGREEITRWMPRFAATAGLVVDIRGNPGGSRNIGEVLFNYLARASGAPRVANAARYRLYREFGAGFLNSRHMYPAEWGGWSAEERQAIADFRASFRPEWRVPEGEFSDWHYWLPRKRSAVADYLRPVVFLMDGKCFSASDVTLAAVKGLPNVTLVGGASGGGSGAPVFSTLANSGLEPYLSSMASFQRSGLLFDGHGVEPDIEVEPLPEFFLVNGRDRALEIAVETILRL